MSTTVSAVRRSGTASPRGAGLRVLVLLLLWVWLFWPDIRYVAGLVPANGDSTHALAAPALVLCLVYRRKQALAASLTTGSLWGVVLVVVGLLAYAAATWPFNFAYARLLATMPVLMGIVLTAGGWRLLERTLPMVLLVALSIPISQRVYARLSIRPATLSLAAARVALDRLPGVNVRLDGPDLHFTRGGSAGTIALGEHHRGMTLVLAYAMIGLFVVFSRVRPFWQVVVLAVVGFPVVALCNVVRLLTWGVVTIYADLATISMVPRAAAAIFSLFCAYLAFTLLGGVLDRLFVEDNSDEQAPCGLTAPAEEQCDDYAHI